MKPVKRSKFVYEVQKGSSLFRWEIRETRSRRWYCFDHNSFCFTWSYMPELAANKLKDWAAKNGYTVLGRNVVQGCTVN